MPLTNRPNFVFLFATSLLAALAGACAGGDPAEPQIPTEQLPAYTTEEQAVFDDSIAPEVFGLEVDSSSVHDPRFVSRAKTADYISRAKLLTISSDELAGQIRYHIVLKPIGEPIVGRPVKGNIEITLGRTSPSLMLLRSMAAEGVGRRMLVLLRRYRLDNKPVVHFRAEPDSEAMVQAVRKALRKQED